MEVVKNILLTELILKTEWFEWFNKKTTPWFIATPHPVKEWIILQFKDSKSYEKIKFIYEHKNTIFYERSKFIDSLFEATITDYELELETIKNKNTTFI